jgi:hypothetical protein
MLESVRLQIERVRQDYPDLEVASQPDGSIRIFIKNFRLPLQWGRQSTNILVTLPAGYPQAMPSGFQAQLDGQNWTGFCWRPSTWNPSRDNVWKWIKLIEKFFEENRP